MKRQPSLQDVAARVDVRVQGRSAAFAAEQVSRRSIASGGVPAAGALLAGVGRVDFGDGDAVEFLNAFQFRRNGGTTRPVLVSRRFVLRLRFGLRKSSFSTTISLTCSRPSRLNSRPISLR